MKIYAVIVIDHTIKEKVELEFASKNYNEAVKKALAIRKDMLEHLQFNYPKRSFNSTTKFYDDLTLKKIYIKEQKRKQKPIFTIEVDSCDLQ